MEAKYDSKIVEPKIQKFWLDKKIFRFDEHSKKPIFSVDTPPPTISGKLHMGHARSYTNFEMIARYKRMRGFNVLFPIGFDNNGQPTERYVEKELKINLNTISKTEFIKLVKEHITKVEERYKNDLLLMGHSHDWSMHYKTINDNCAKAAQLSFLDLYKKDLVYRSEEPTIWCTSCRTALSQADVEDKKRQSVLFYINFETENEQKIEIATSRPELLPACVGLFVNPNDERHKKLVGKRIRVPIFDQIVPVMADEKVDPNFGTGIVMICTFGDKTDIDWWKSYNLPLKIIVNRDGTLNELAEHYKGLKLEVAKKEIIKELESKKFIVKKEPLEQNVGTCWRCGNPTEYIVTKQWFVKILENKNEFIKQGRKIKWYPEYYIKRYEDWINNLRWDWLISRQRHHGIPIPIWYCKECDEVLLPDKEDLPVDPDVHKPKKKCKCGSHEFIAEKDVFDTWMTSSMTPQIVLEWADGKMKDKLLPMSLRPQAHDIIRTWAFYTIVKSYYHFNKIPWESIMISGHTLDSKGNAMHKSLGNIVEIKDIIDKYSSDILRYWTTNGKLGDDICIQDKDFINGSKLVTKLWNATRFVSVHIENIEEPDLEPSDKWLMAKLMKTIKEVSDSFDSFEYSSARSKLDYFFWNIFCDNYLEMVKYRIYGEKDKSCVWTLYNSILSLIKMYCPITPHVTEEIYQELFKKYEPDTSLCISPWPEYRTDLIDDNFEKGGDLAVEVIAQVRKWKHDKNLALNADVKSIIIKCNKNQKKMLEEFSDDIKGTIRVKHIDFEESEAFGVDVLE